MSEDTVFPMQAEILLCLLPYLSCIVLQFLLPCKTSCPSGANQVESLIDYLFIHGTCVMCTHNKEVIVI